MNRITMKVSRSDTCKGFCPAKQSDEEGLGCRQQWIVEA